MSCVCLMSLKAMLKSLLAALKSLPLNLLASMLPDGLLSMMRLAPGLANASAYMSLSARLNAALALPLPQLSMSASALASLSAMASISAALGISPLAAAANASLSAKLSMMMQTANINLLALLPLANLLAPLMAALGELMDLLNGLAAFKAMGFNLALGAGAAWPKLSLALSAMANLNIALPSTAALANFSMMMNAAAALGFNLSAGLSASVAARLSAALSLAASLKLPALAIPLPALTNVTCLLGVISAVKSQFGINLMLPNAFDLLKAALAALIAELGIPALSANLSAVAAAGASLGAVMPALQLNLNAAANLNLSAMASLKMPSMLGLSMVANLAAQMNLALGMNPIAASACSSSCPMAI